MFFFSSFHRTRSKYKHFPSFRTVVRSRMQKGRIGRLLTTNSRGLSAHVGGGHASEFPVAGINVTGNPFAIPATLMYQSLYLYGIYGCSDTALEPCIEIGMSVISWTRLQLEVLYHLILPRIQPHHLPEVTGIPLQ